METKAKERLEAFSISYNKAKYNKQIYFREINGS